MIRDERRRARGRSRGDEPVAEVRITLDFYQLHRMKTRRRDFLKLAGLTGLGAAGLSNAAAAIIEHSPDLFSNHPDMTPELKNAVKAFVRRS